MKKKNLKNKKVFMLIAVVMAVVVACCAILPFFIKNEAKNYMYGDATKAQGLDLTGYDISIGADTKLLFNSKLSTFALHVSDSNEVFYSHNYDAAENSFASIFDIRLRDGKGNSYSMDSSANSVSFGEFKVEERDGTHFLVNYTLYPEKPGESVDKEKSLFVTVPVRFELKNGRFLVSVDTSKISCSKGMFVEKLTILPGLFSVGTGAKNTYYTVPDGCGAVINLETVSETPLSLKLNMYGEDVAFYEYSQGALLPFFALTKNGFSVNAIIEEGDALSQITCKRFEKGGGYLYNTFTITACGVVDGKFVVGESYDGTISQAYVVEGENSDYNNIAAQVRDSLTERNYLNTTLNANFTDLPFIINVVGSHNGKTPLTTFEDAAEITALLKSRGVRNIALRFSGYDKKGLDSIDAGNQGFADSLGGADGFSSLCKEITEQSNSLYIDTNVVTRKGDKGIGLKIYDETSKFVGYMPEEFCVADKDSVNKNIGAAYKFTKDFTSSNMCLNDGSNFLYTDLKGKNNRQDMLENLRENTSALSAAGSLMLSSPAVYLMKQADVVFSTPNVVSCDGQPGVTVVPVLQMVLHGSVIYGSMPMNVSNLSPDDVLLKCVEYGCVPSFLFTHSADTGISYSSYATRTVKLYSKAKQMNPLMKMKITSHEKVTDGVYKITYDYAKIVYVNYNPSVVEVNGVMISAKDFIVI